MNWCNRIQRDTSTLTSMHRKHGNNRKNSEFDHNWYKKCYVTFLCILYLFTYMLVPVCGQTVNQGIRPFPPLFNAAENRQILTEPSQSTCGVQGRSAYCRSSTFASSVVDCTQDFCVQQCPGREEMPEFKNLLIQSPGFSDCVFKDNINTRPSSEFLSASTSFIGTGPTCFVTPTVDLELSSSMEFTITVWIWQNKNNDGTLIQKVSNETGEIIFEINIRESMLSFVYKSSIGLHTVTFPDPIPPETWTYVAIQVFGTNSTSVSFFLDGVGPAFSATHTEALVSQVQDSVGYWVRVGLTLSGTYQYQGRLQDFKFYPMTLTNREIEYDFSGVFPSLRVHSDCRCPASHPRVKPLQIHYCIKNGVPDNTIDAVRRLDSQSHPLEYVNDGDANSIWISDFMEKVNLLVDLGDDFQVFYVVLLFYSPLPKAVEIQKKTINNTLQWETLQQFATDCQYYFNKTSNGALPTPTSVNCLQIPTIDAQYSKGNITFNILNPEPSPRPGYNDFYHTPELFDFVSASEIRVKLQDHLLVTKERHKYFGLFEYSVIARCECFGHASTCDHSRLPYTCDCLPESHTQGRQCDQCEPLYNDKPFRRGDQVDAFNCRPCECYGHATACMYNETLDQFPADHFSGGGGVCIDCQDYTEGRFCETCITEYYRPTGKSRYDVDVCQPCNCYRLGVLNFEADCEKEGGQCLCKTNVEARQCDVCKNGFYNLTNENPLGCDPCDCDTQGTTLKDVSCDFRTGACNCKDNVQGLKCDSCRYGFFNLNASNPDGCDPCNCNPSGSTNQFCDPDSGQCICKNNIVGRQCDECADGFWAFEDGCLPCNCSIVGSLPPGKCSKDTGQCECKPNTQGLKCDVCRDETYGFGNSEDLGCVPCLCNTAGTVNGSMLCDKIFGNCVCKANVQGASCNQCKGNTWGLSSEFDDGCVPCECDPTGTQLGDTMSSEDLSCHQNTGQCTCLANRIGRQCDDCDSGYFVSYDLGGGCLPCICHSKATLPLTNCHSKTGQCECRGGDAGVTGISCDECLEGFYGFDGFEGRCSDCDCSVAGSLNTTCDQLDGQCFCKEFTMRRRCDRCEKNSSLLDEQNPYGCSKAPAQQPPPTHEDIDSTSLRLTWTAPDYPNGVIEQYRLFRNHTLIFTLTGDERTVVDTDLQPFTLYSYIVEATNANGSVNSSAISFKTPAGAPYGVVILNATNIKAKSAQFRWNEPQIMNGPLLKYVLFSYTEYNDTRLVFWEGQLTQVSLSTLVPFTNYTFYVDSCTTGGCLTSEPFMFKTMSAAPEGMFPPVVMAVNNSALHISWEPPEFPNGIIIFYELWMRGTLRPDGTRLPSATRIFHPSGLYNPRPTTMPQKNALPPPATEYVLSGLVPFTLYEFQVLAENSAQQKAASPWVSGRTGATTPLSTPSPIIISLSPFALNVTWEPPSDDASRGVIILYRLFYYMKTDLVTNPFAPPYMWTKVHEGGPEVLHFVLGGLSPYSQHTVLVETCNTVGCVNSSSVMGRTRQDIPEGLEDPNIISLNSSAMHVLWTEPAFPNGPSPYYTLQKTTPALSFPPQVIGGTRFPGGGYYLFPPNTIPPNVDFTGVRFWFRTRKRDGLLLFAASEDQREFISLQFKAGRPWFLYDPQAKLCLVPGQFLFVQKILVPYNELIATFNKSADCPTWVTLVSDPNNDIYITLNDGEWHYIEFTRYNYTGTIRVDYGLYGGCASFVTPTNDEGLPYNDNRWHQMVAWRDANVAYISIDNTWTGTREARCAKGTIIGPNTGVYVGGLPIDFEIRRNSNDPRLQLIDHSFQGCIRDIEIMQQRFPTEVWKLLDWEDAIHNELAFLNWEGCPINLDNGVHFMGQGYARFPYDLFQLGNSKKIEFGFRSQMHTGIIFFAYGGTGIYTYCALINGALHFEFANGISVGSVTYNRPETNFCDSRWYNIILEKTGQEAKLTVIGLGVETSGDPNVAMNVLTSSDFWVGGIQAGTEAYEFVMKNKLSMPMAAFGGCIREMTFDDFTTLEYLEESLEVVNVNMDGCTPFHLFTDTCRDDLITEVYNGTAMSAYDINLNPYTDYLYRVLATNGAGAGIGPWGYGRTKEGSPLGVTPPYEAYHWTGYLVLFKWLAPVSTAGLLTQFVLRAYNIENPDIPPVEAIFTNITKREGNMTNTIPYTRYDVKMLACTSGGCSESPDGLEIRTKEEAPKEVPMPRGISGPQYIYVNWDPPGAPNGLLTGYFLYMDGELIYTGAGRAFNVTNDLQVYTSYVFYLKACTQVGCTEGPSTVLSSAQLAPQFVKPPLLISLGTTRVNASWETPEMLNGVLERYLLYVSEVREEYGAVVYNNSDFFLNYVINGLVPGSTYFIRLSACTGGGCTISEPSNITTQESAPGQIKEPIVTSPSPTQLHVEWVLPGSPNGEIIRYELFHNDVPVYVGIRMYYDIGGLLPYSQHAFRVVACTRKGCGSSNLVKARTREAKPEGFVTMELEVVDARTVSVKWTVPEKPNGNMMFDVYFEGIFYVDPENWNYSTVFGRRSLNRSQLHDQWVMISPVIPMSSYNVQVNASNTVGFILGNTITADMPPGSPDGVKPPELISQTPTTITATWVPVGRENSADGAVYTLQFREKVPGALVEDAFGKTTSFTYTKDNLLAYREYEFRIVAENSNGATRSTWVTATTRQDRPVGISTPTVADRGPRYIDLRWSPPITPNGILLQYKVYQNGQYRESTAGNVTLLRVEGLQPYTFYTFVVEACTGGGCSRSSPSTASRTRDDYPDNIEPPTAISLTPASVEITWSAPSAPNGVISLYTLQRREPGQEDYITIATIEPDLPLQYVDEDSSLTPHTQYEYRILVTNGAGDGASPWTLVETMSSRPAGVKAPVIIILNPTVMNVSWEPPLQPNGVIEFYTVQLPEPRVEIRNISIMSVLFEDLVPYTEYEVTVTACTSGGCTESQAVNVRTHAMVPELQRPPIATPVSQTMISLIWQGPERPNGPNIRFEMSRLLIRQPLSPEVDTSSALWIRIYSGTGFFFEDRGLPMYSTYRYRLTVFNDIGQMTSDPTDEVTTFGGFPRRAAKVTAIAISHRVVGVSWEVPDEISLQGRAESFTVRLMSHLRNYTQELIANRSTTTFIDLQPNTQYYTTVTVTINGGAYITSDPVYVTTMDGAPEGVDKPTLSIVSETAIRVSWMAPEKPNGAITGYYVYKNDERIQTGLTLPGSYVLTGLQPYTVYQIQVEVCTVFDCVRSETVLGSTLETYPFGLEAPRVIPLSPYQINIMWEAPEQPNGIILRYDLWRKTITQCSEIPKVTVSPELEKCTYIQCGILQNLCGSTCYSGAKVCCNGVLHDSMENHECCGTNYALMSHTSDVCCNGVFYTYMENYQCCNGRYERVLPGQICCPDYTEDRVSVGTGDSCCGTVPYTQSGAQVCCSGQLYEKHDQQCCGGDMVSDDLICCGNETYGQAFTSINGMSCCGHHYVYTDSTLCCHSDTGHYKVHEYGDPEEKVNANEECCGLQTISRGLACCNFVGYNPAIHYCADISHHQSGCGSGTICPRSQKDTSFCDRCDFDPFTYMCGSTSGRIVEEPVMPTPKPSDDCVLSEDRIYSGLNTDYFDNDLLPYSLYEYAVSVINSAGSVKSDFTEIKTLQARPEGLESPRVVLDPRQLYLIFLTWKPPAQTNGEILRYILSRDGIELYRGLDLRYTDDTTILPYRSYTYILTACTIAGCISSPSITVATAQAAPEGIHQPMLEVINATALLVKWFPPDIPNGIISEYIIYFYGGNHNHTRYNTTQRSIIITGLLPYTQYFALLGVCTEVACTNSTQVSKLMPESAPEGVLPPEIIVRSATSVDVYWTPPTQPNGVVVFYGLIRSERNNQIRVFLGENFHATDYSLDPGRTYNYFIIVGTRAGNTSSDSSLVTMPDNTPTNIPEPLNVTVISATEIFVEWEPIPPEYGVIDQYRVLLNAGRQAEVDRGVGLATFVMISSLLPYTMYEVRIQACLEGVPNGCGTGPGVVIQTFEAAPTFLEKPMLETNGPNIVDIYWSPPKYPNGVITHYLVYYRNYGSDVELLINRLGNDSFYVRHAGNELSPFHQYEYKIVAGNSQGDVSSPWSLIRTQAAPPTGLPQPIITVTGGYSVDLKWSHPAKPNGIIYKYEILYKILGVDPTILNNTLSITVNGSVTQTSVSGLKPYSDYQLQLEAFNSVGNVSSPWTTFKTGESSPAGLGLFDIETINTGTAVILRWGPPVNPNGIITTYRIYESESSVAVFQGLNRVFELRRLDPYKEYSVQLEACTSAGCTRSFMQPFYTAETAPSGQPNPSMGNITSSSVTVTWLAPLNPNGRIQLYEVYRRTNNRIQKRSVTSPVIVYRTTDTDKESFTYTDTNLQPFTEYQYSISASNSKGTTTSDWQSAFTTQAPPAGVQPPFVSHLDDQINALQIAWRTPDRPNGILQSYRLQRNDSIPLSFSIVDFKEYIDTGLNAYTYYSYTITACSGGGCTTSDPTIIQTKETAPLNVSPPTVFAVNSTALRITWVKPQITTGEISAYQLYMNGLVVYEGMGLEYMATNLIPFTDYTFRLSACTTGGCRSSGEITGKTGDAEPSGMLPPILRVMSSSSIEISWQQPQYSNGLITSYDVRRNGKLIFTESITVSGSLRIAYTDYNLEPGTEYAYIVIARNRKGSTESPSSVARTFASSPSGLSPPLISALSSTSLQVSWDMPANPNGDIKNFTLFRDGAIVYSGGPTQLSYIVPGLKVWTEYTFRVQACTDRGCTLSSGASSRTLGSQPEEQAPPILLALANQDGAHSGVLIEWDPPLQPNGVVQVYEVYRREVIDIPTGTVYGPSKMVYNGSMQSYTDRDLNLKPFTKYEYSIAALNVFGKVNSLWTQVTTKEAPPESVPPPTVNSTLPTTISVIITPPSEPNGVVRYYNVLVNNTVASSSVDLFQIVGQTVSLLPFKFYSITVQACTAGGCTTSPPVIAQTGTAKPSGQEPLRVLSINSTAVKLAWNHPTNPNGEILKFMLYQRTACPPTVQPYDQNCAAGEPEKVYEGMYIEYVDGTLLPYKAYDFQVQSVNRAGPIDFPVWVRAETIPSLPQYVKFPLLSKNDSLAIVDWSASFVLNSRLREFQLTMEGSTVYSGVAFIHSLQRSSPNENLLFRIKAITDTGEVESPVVVFDPSSVNNIGTTPSVVASTETVASEPEFYEQIWFIVLMIVIGVLLLLVCLGCCIRKCSKSNPYIRERMPLQSMQKQPFTFMVDSSDGSLVAMDAPPPNTDRSGYYSGSVANGVVNPAYASNNFGKKGLHLERNSDSLFEDDYIDEDEEDFIWDKNMDSGLVSGYDSESLDAPSYSITKEQTVFTDTHL